MLRSWWPGDSTEKMSSSSWVIIGAVAAEDDLASGQISTWDLSTGTALPELAWKEVAVQDACLLPSRQNPFLPAYLASTALRTAALHIHWLAGGKDRPVARWYGHDQVGRLAGSACGRWLAGGSEKGGLVVWDLETGAMLASTPDAHLRRITSVKFTTNNIITASEDGTVKVWSLDTLLSSPVTKPKFIFDGHPSMVADLHVGLTQGRLLSCSSDGTTLIHDLTDGLPLAKYRIPVGLTHCLMNATETCLFLAGQDGDVYLIQLDKPEEASVKLASPSGKPLKSMALSPDEACLVTADTAGLIVAWSVAGRTVQRQIQAAAPVHWLTVIPRAALNRKNAELPRAFPQLRKAQDQTADANTIETLLFPLASTLAATTAVPTTTDLELEALRVEHEKLKEAHRTLLDSVNSMLSQQ